MEFYFPEKLLKRIENNQQVQQDQRPADRIPAFEWHRYQNAVALQGFELSYKRKGWTPFSH